jgi:hypothetical protein|tara:strand:- start:1971 stop:2681 length:711 start_codon:yes stop_codon:yes gene_type:complete
VNAILQSVCNNYEDIISITSPVNQRYSKKVGAEYVLHKQKFEHNRYPSWNKIYSTINLFEEGYDYVFFLDGDAMVVDHSRNIFDLATDPKILFHVCAEEMQKPFSICMGAFLIKRDPLMLRFLNDILETDSTTGFVSSPSSFVSFYEEEHFFMNWGWEQSAAVDILRRDSELYKDVVKIYTNSYFNNTGNWVFHTKMKPCEGPGKLTRDEARKNWKCPRTSDKVKMLNERKKELTF